MVYIHIYSVKYAILISQGWKKPSSLRTNDHSTTPMVSLAFEWSHTHISKVIWCEKCVQCSRNVAFLPQRPFGATFFDPESALGRFFPLLFFLKLVQHIHIRKQNQHQRETIITYAFSLFKTLLWHFCTILFDLVVTIFVWDTLGGFP